MIGLLTAWRGGGATLYARPALHSTPHCNPKSVRHSAPIYSNIPPHQSDTLVTQPIFTAPCPSYSSSTPARPSLPRRPHAFQGSATSPVAGDSPGVDGLKATRGPAMTAASIAAACPESSLCCSRNWSQASDLICAGAGEWGCLGGDEARVRMGGMGLRHQRAPGYRRARNGGERAIGVGFVEGAKCGGMDCPQARKWVG